MNDLEKISQLAEELYDYRENKKFLEDNIKEINKKIKDIEEHQLSTLLDEQQVKDISIKDLEISKSLIFRGAYTKHKDKDAFKFLYDSDNDGALKKVVLIDLDQNPDILEKLDQIHIEYAVEYSIHHATLSSIIKELVETGKLTMEDIEKYNIYIQPQVRVKKKTGD